MFSDAQIEATGTIELRARHRIDVSVRVAHLIESLNDLMGRWNHDAVAYSQPTGIGWKVPALQLLESALVEW